MILKCQSLRKHILIYIYIYIYICIFRQHFLVNANFIKHNRHFMFTYFLLDPFEFPYYFYCITECNFSLHEITSVFQSAVIFMSCRIMKFKICIFRQHFFVNANFIKHNRHFMSTYFLLDLQIQTLEYRRDLVKRQITLCNTIKVIREFERIQKKICRHKMSIMFNELCIYIYIYIYSRIALSRTYIISSKKKFFSVVSFGNTSYF